MPTPLSPHTLVYGFELPGDPQVSPDGTCVVYSLSKTDEKTNKTGTQLWLCDIDGANARCLTSNGTRNGSARWSPDGRYVYFWRTAPIDTLFRARIDRTPTIVVHAPEVVVALDADGVQNWDLHPDGRRFIVAVADASPAANASAGPPPRYVIHQNWFGELRRLTAVKPR